MALSQHAARASARRASARRATRTQQRAVAVRAKTMEEEAKEMADAQSRWESQVREGKVRSVGAKETVSLVADPEWVLLDVRPPEEVKKGRVPSSVTVPLFVVDDDLSVGGILKQMSAFGMGGWWLGGAHMKANPNFISSVLNKVPKDKKVVVCCQKGLRSLAACEQLAKVGYSQIAWLNGGFEGSMKGDFDTTDGQDIRLAGTGGLSSVIGWTPIQQADEPGIGSGPENVLKIVAALTILDILIFGNSLTVGGAGQ